MGGFESLNMSAIVIEILREYSLPISGVHGIAHWARVLENGLRLAEITGADTDVVTLFAIFHDSRRINEGHDNGHGFRGAELAACFRGRLFDICDAKQID